MELLICGSGSSEAVPALFCTCEVCQQAWKNGGRDIRSRTAYQLGEEIRIDFGPDLMLHRFLYNLHYEKLKHLFITHPHRDHFQPVQLNYHLHGEIGPAILQEQPLTLYGTAQVMKQFHENLTSDFSKMRMILDELDPIRDLRILENGIRVTSIQAKHCPGAVHYIFEIPHSGTLLIGTDSAGFSEATWRILSEFRFDIVILDGTAGLLEIENGSHMNARQAVETAQRMRKEGMVSPNCRFFTNHFAHCGKMLHKDLVHYYAPYDITPAYDGLRIELTVR
ncbi:MAG: hypothetical protein IKO93_13460 [Lentisphaeria bacterium]|nr:hypothetical protein [Lentisphaeria bacterium]